MKRANFMPYEGQDPFIFISYAHKNSDRVIPILEKLHEAGYRVWYDDGIAPGSEWPEYIAEHLNGCRTVISFVSPESIDSPNCRREVTYALSKRKPFLGILLEETKMSPGMELQLSAQQCILRHNYRTEEEFLNKILTAEMLKPCRRPEETDAVPAEAPAAGPAAYAGGEERISGTNAGAAGSQISAEAVKPAKKKLNPLVWILPAACLLIVAVLAIAGVFRGKETDPTESSRKTSAAGTQEAVSNDTKPAQTDPVPVQTEPSKEAQTAEPAATAEAPTEPETTEAPPEETEKEPLKGELEKLMSVSMKDGRDYELTAAGVAYLEEANELLGLMAYDGVSDTGALYPKGGLYGSGEDYAGKYLIVSQNGSEFEKTAESLNRYGIIDPKGREILPEEYAEILDCNEFYALCIKVTEETADPEEAVLSFYADTFDKNDSSNQNVYFKGEWTLISLKTGQPVPGFSGTKASEYDSLKYGSALCGELIETGDGKRYMRANGSLLPAGADVFKNGCYTVTEPSKGTLYRADGTEVFSFDPNDSTLSYDTGGYGYFSGRKLGDGYGYTLLNQKGQAVSAEIQVQGISAPMTIGPFLFVRNGFSQPYHVYGLDGNLITEKEVETFGTAYDELHRVLKLRTSDGGWLFVREDGEILGEFDKNLANIFDFFVGKSSAYYNFSTKEYEIKGSKVWNNGWVSVLNDGGKYDLVDVFTGARLLRGYDRYMVVKSPEYGVILGAVYNQTIDVYVLK
ncbi:MAG: toll/interleukin-1 receptor domain-containing protein [Lachnospiraceae bacterium]|nr:toll/interleukin-1 receptor domain-containing protein [Lachnospiraceae bacterium]